MHPFGLLKGGKVQKSDFAPHVTFKGLVVANQAKFGWFSSTLSCDVILHQTQLNTKKNYIEDLNR